MTQFNPNTPHAIGVEWWPFNEANPFIRERGAVGGSEFGAAVLFANLTEDIDRAILYFIGRGTKFGRGGGYEMEIWDLDDLTYGDEFVITKVQYRPDTDVTKVRAAWFNGVALSTTNIYQGIDEAVASGADWIQNAGKNNALQQINVGSSFEASFRFGSLAGTLVGFHLVGVALNARVTVSAADGNVGPMTITPYLNIGGKRYFGDAVTITDEEPNIGHNISYIWPANPDIGRSWLPSDLDNFDSGSDSAGWLVDPVGKSSSVPKILQGYLEVWHVGPEERKATGVIPICDTVEDILIERGWLEMALSNPVTGNPFEKVAGTKYLMLVQRKRGSGAAAWRYLDQLHAPVAFPVSPQRPPQIGAEPLPGPPFWTSAQLQVDADTLLPIPPVLNTDLSAAYAIILGLDGLTTLSLDSQPYASIKGDGHNIPTAVGPLNSPYLPWGIVQCEDDDGVEPTVAIEQELTPPFTLNYGYVRFQVRLRAAPDGYLGEPDRLVARLYDRATNTQQGGTVFITRDDLTPNAPTQLQEVGKYIPDNPMLTAATQYYWRISTAAQAGRTSVGVWEVNVLTTVPYDVNNPPPAGVEDVTWGAGIDCFTYIADPAQTYNGEYCDLTAAIVTHTVPDTPEGFNVAATPEPLGTDLCSTDDVDDIINYVEIMWTPTDIPADEGCGFAFYEIERDDHDGHGFQVIAHITDENCNSFDDYEAKVGSPTYRMRVFRGDGSPSYYTDEFTVDVVMHISGAGGYVYSTNLSPEHNVWYAAERPITFEFLGNSEYVQFHGRNFGVEFKELEDRGDRLIIKTIINFSEARCDPLTPETEGRRLFTPLLVLGANKRDPDTLEKLTLPYVAVRDYDGNRWFSSLTFGTGERYEPGKIYKMEVVATEVTDVPAAVDKVCTPGPSTGSGCDIPLGS